jgi:TRAP transporter 4TM/12TM fusion protein
MALVKPEIKTDEILEEARSTETVYDRKHVAYWLAIIISLFHIWVNTFGVMSELWRNALHMGLLGMLGYFTIPAVKKFKERNPLKPLDIFLGLLIFATALYIIFFEDALHDRNEVVILPDLIAAGIAVILSIELTRRTTGIIIPLIAIFFATYLLFWGAWVPGQFHFRGMSLSRFLYRMFFTDEGLFGITASISSTFVFMFILFAAFLLKSGGGDFIINLAQIITKNITGGPAIVAVASSGLMGTISGSAIANTVSTGSITIPMMKKAGFKPEFAAAVETAASTGGQIMPPIMGAGAFIMAEWTRVPYVTIIAVAFLPAVMYFATVGFFVYQTAKKMNIKPLEQEHEMTLWEVMREGLHFFIPIIVLIYLLVIGFSPTFSAGYSIIAIVLSSYLSKNHKMKFFDILDSLALGAKNMVMTGILLITVGVIIGSISITGIAITFSQLIVEISGGSLILALVLITLASLLLGMGLPVTAAYIMLAIIAVPALQHLGVALLSAHMIIFWVSQDSNVTPPVCLAAFAAAGIAGSRPMKTGFEAWKLAKGLYVMPLLFAYTDLIDGSFMDKLDIFIFGLLGLYAFASVFTGFFVRPLNPFMRLLVGIIGILLLIPHYYTWISGAVLFVLFAIYQLKFQKATEQIETQ